MKYLATTIVSRYYTKQDLGNLLADNEFSSLKIIDHPLSYSRDGLYTMHNSDFIREPKFVQSYQLGKATGSWGQSDIEWRAYVACWVADKVKSLDGDFVECGVNKGGLSRTIIDYIDFDSLDKRFYLFDTFNGLVDDYISEEERKIGIEKGGYEECFEQVIQTFRRFNVEIIKGPVPDTLVGVNFSEICYLSIDMNCVKPEIEAATFFWDKIVSGGIILLDDYGWPGHINQKYAFDNFAKEKGVMILPLPTGQGIIFKP